MLAKYLHRKNEKGISLIEVLVSIIILSIGLLGIAGLQAAVLKYQIGTQSRAALAGLFSDIADRIRINSDVAGNNFITGVNETSQYALAANWSNQQADALTTPNPDCISTSCTTAERASYDMIAWRQLIRTNIPQGAALISGNRSAGFNVTLMWFDKEFTDKGNAADSVLVSAPTCTGNESGIAQQQCCPAVVAAPAGVRCARFSFIP